MPAVIINHPLPEGVTDHDELEAVVCDIARDMHKYVHLMLSTRVSIWINPEGKVYLRSEPGEDGQPNVPTVNIRGKPIRRDLFDSLSGDNTED